MYNKIKMEYSDSDSDCEIDIEDNIDTLINNDKIDTTFKNIVIKKKDIENIPLEEDNSGHTYKRFDNNSKLHSVFKNNRKHEYKYCGGYNFKKINGNDNGINKTSKINLKDDEILLTIYHNGLTNNNNVGEFDENFNIIRNDIIVRRGRVNALSINNFNDNLNIEEFIKNNEYHNFCDLVEYYKKNHNVSNKISNDDIEIVRKFLHKKIIKSGKQFDRFKHYRHAFNYNDIPVENTPLPDKDYCKKCVCGQVITDVCFITLDNDPAEIVPIGNVCAEKFMGINTISIRICDICNKQNIKHQQHYDICYDCKKNALNIMKKIKKISCNDINCNAYIQTKEVDRLNLLKKHIYEILLNKEKEFDSKIYNLFKEFGYIELDVSFNEKDKIKFIYGVYWSKNLNKWIYKPSLKKKWDNTLKKWVFGGLETTPDIIRKYIKYDLEK